MPYGNIHRTPYTSHKYDNVANVKVAPNDFDMNIYWNYSAATYIPKILFFNTHLRLRPT